MMRWGGLALLLFVVWHLINFTIGKVNVTGGPTNDPYNLLVDSFSTWWLTVIYLLAMVALGMHLRHGVWSAAQTLGVTNNARARRNAKVGGVVAAVVIAGGFALVPIFILRRRDHQGGVAMTVDGRTTLERTGQRRGGLLRARRADRGHQGPRWPDRACAGRPASSRPGSPTRPTAAGCRSSWWAPGWPARRPRPPWARPATW